MGLLCRAVAVPSRLVLVLATELCSCFMPRSTQPTQGLCSGGQMDVPRQCERSQRSSLSLDRYPYACDQGQERGRWDGDTFLQECCPWWRLDHPAKAIQQCLCQLPPPCSSPSLHPSRHHLLSGWTAARLGIWPNCPTCGQHSTL